MQRLVLGFGTQFIGGLQIGRGVSPAVRQDSSLRSARVNERSRRPVSMLRRTTGMTRYPMPQ